MSGTLSLWAVRTQSSYHPKLELGCAMVHTWSPTRLLLHQTLLPLATWLWDNACLPICGHRQRQGFHSSGIFYCVSSPSLCVSCLCLYWLNGEGSPNKPGNVHLLCLCIIKALMVIQINSWTKSMAIVSFKVIYPLKLFSVALGI